MISKLVRAIRKYGILTTVVVGLIQLTESELTNFYQKRVEHQVQVAGDNLYVNGQTNLTQNTRLGDNVNFNGLIVRGGGELDIGDNFHSGPDCLILTRNHNYDDGNKIPYDDTYIQKKVIIGDNVWLGARVTIIPGITIGEGAIIQAGSTVVNDIPEGAIAGGHPAEVFDYRDMDHYTSLKDQEAFH